LLLRVCSARWCCCVPRVPARPGRRCRSCVRPTKNPLAGGTGGCGRTRCGVRRQV